MRKTIKLNGNPEPGKLQTYMSALVSRANLASKLGTQTYGGDRDIYQALGYPKLLDFKNNFFPQYSRQDIAKAIIDRPVRAAWRGGFTLKDVKAKGEDSAIQKAWKDLEKKHKVHSVLMRLDKLTGIGRYGILMLGLNDVTKTEDLATPVAGASNKLIYLKPLSEGSASIIEWDTNVNSVRYGKPVMYNIVVGSSQGQATSIRVHYTRVIHIVEDVLEDEVAGTPRLQAVFNRLLDLEKIVGGSAEMFWRGARPGFKGVVDKDFQLTPDSEEGLQDQFDEYENALRRFLLLEGVDVEALAQVISDPSNTVDVQIQMISAVTGIPKRILMGSERGELSSAQDKEEWNLWVQSRREEFMEPQIVRAVVDRFMELGILPKVEDYLISWDELFAMSPKEKAEIAEKLANAIRYYTATPTAEYILPKKYFLQRLLGLTDDELKEVDRLVDELPELEPPMGERERMQLEGEQAAKQQKIGGPIKDPNKGTGNDTIAKKQKA